MNANHATNEAITPRRVSATLGKMCQEHGAKSTKTEHNFFTYENVRLVRLLIYTHETCAQRAAAARRTSVVINKENCGEYLWNCNVFQSTVLPQSSSIWQLIETFIVVFLKCSALSEISYIPPSVLVRAAQERLLELTTLSIMFTSILLQCWLDPSQ